MNEWLFGLNLSDGKSFHNRFFSPFSLLSSKSRLWAGDDVQDVGSVQLWDLWRPLLLLPRSMYVHSAAGLWGNRPGQHRRPGEFSLSRSRNEINPPDCKLPRRFRSDACSQSRKGWTRRRPAPKHTLLSDSARFSLSLRKRFALKISESYLVIRVNYH